MVAKSTSRTNIVANCTANPLRFVVEWVWVKKMNDSVAAFCNNLSKYYAENYSTYSQMAADLGISLGTLKCWMSGKRIPKLSTLRELADKMGCYTYNLIKPFGNTEDVGIINNDVHKLFSERLRIVFLERKAITNSKKFYIVNEVISPDTLMSYLRKKDYRLPTLRTLDRIADALNIKSYELLKEDTSND